MQIQVFQASDDVASGWQMLHLAKLQTAPQVLYTSSRVDASFIDHARQPFEAFVDSTDAGGMTLVTPEVRLEKAAIFSYEQVTLSFLRSDLYSLCFSKIAVISLASSAPSNQLIFLPLLSDTLFIIYW